MHIIYQLCESPLEWTGKWVPAGHQDDDTTPTVLNKWAWENIEVNRIAGEYWTKIVPEDQIYWDSANNRFLLLLPPSTKMSGKL